MSAAMRYSRSVNGGFTGPRNDARRPAARPFGRRSICLGSAQAAHRRARDDYRPAARGRDRRARRRGTDARRRGAAGRRVPTGRRRPGGPGAAVRAPLRQGQHPSPPRRRHGLRLPPPVPPDAHRRTFTHSAWTSWDPPTRATGSPAATSSSTPICAGGGHPPGAEEPVLRAGGPRRPRPGRVGRGAALEHRPGRHDRRVLPRDLPVGRRRRAPPAPRGDLPVGGVHRLLPRLRPARRRPRGRLLDHLDPRFTQVGDRGRSTSRAPARHRPHSTGGGPPAPGDSRTSTFRRWSAAASPTTTCTAAARSRASGGSPRPTSGSTRTAGPSGRPTTRRRGSRSRPGSSTTSCGTRTPVPRRPPSGWRSARTHDTVAAVRHTSQLAATRHRLARCI